MIATGEVGRLATSFYTNILKNCIRRIVLVVVIYIKKKIVFFFILPLRYSLHFVKVLSELWATHTWFCSEFHFILLYILWMTIKFHSVCLLHGDRNRGQIHTCDVCLYYNMLVCYKMGPLIAPVPPVPLIEVLRYFFFLYEMSDGDGFTFR